MKKELRLAIGADHRGFQLKNHILQNFTHEQYSIRWTDVGAYTNERSDYPEFSTAVCYHLLKQDVDYGILLCGTGVGMAIAANRFPSIYAGVAWNEEIARKGKEDDNINVLVIPADFVEKEQVLSMIKAWLDAQFKMDRYQKRIEMIDAITS